MDFLTDWLTDWLKELLIGGIMGNLEGLFDTVNARVGEIAVQVGTTPAAWNAGVFSLIRQLSETVILPIAGLVLTFVATYELIQMLLEKNNMHEVDVANIYKWMFKTACAIFILSNTFNIVMAVFDVSQSVIARSAGLIRGSTAVSQDMLNNLQTTLEGMDLGPLLGLWFQSSVIGLTMNALSIIIFVMVYGRMIEIYLLTSLAPLPVATLSNRELGGTGQNYLKSLFAVGFQGVLSLVCVAIYAVLVQGIAAGGDPIGAIWGTVGYTVLLCFMLFKTGTIAPASSGPTDKRTSGQKVPKAQRGGDVCHGGISWARTGKCAGRGAESSRRNLPGRTCWRSWLTQTCSWAGTYQKKHSPRYTRRAMTIRAGPCCPGPERRIYLWRKPRRRCRPLKWRRKPRRKCAA